MTLREAGNVLRNFAIVWVHLFGIATITILMVVLLHLYLQAD
jgi:hypothetical protein